MQSYTSTEEATPGWAALHALGDRKLIEQIVGDVDNEGDLDTEVQEQFLAQIRHEATQNRTRLA